VWGLRREAGGEKGGGGGGGEYLGEGSGRCFCWASSSLVGDLFIFRSFKCCIIALSCIIMSSSLIF
jgi:hypothetical protein